MSRRIFQAGLKHSVVDAKWPAFEEVFKSFAPTPVASYPDEELEAMLQDKRLIRHMAKLQATRANAAVMIDVAKGHGSVAGWVAEWPITDITGLWAALAKAMKQLIGNSAPVYLRMISKDTFVPADSMASALVHWEAQDATPKGKADLARLQAVFTFWHEETGKSLSHLSMILAMSVD